MPDGINASLVDIAVTGVFHALKREGKLSSLAVLKAKGLLYDTLRSLGRNG